MTDAGAGSLRSVSLHERYSSGSNDLVAEFYTPCLAHAVTYDRAVGFFSSTLLVLVGTSLAEFGRRGGTMRLLCCPRLSEKDIEALRAGYELRATAGEALSRELVEMVGDPVGEAATKLLATLVAAGTLEVRIAFRPGATGIYHDKVGVFSDSAGDQITFSGSINESWSAWSPRDGNHEGFHAFASWSDPSRARGDSDYFERLWIGRMPGLEVLDFPDVAADRLAGYADPDGLVHAEEQLRASLQDSMQRPRHQPVLRQHQVDVIADWRDHAHRGLVEHATGSGKTITALTASGEALVAGHAVVIVVPAVALLEQWEQEVRSFLPDASILLVGSGNDAWRQGATLRNFVSPNAFNPTRQRVVIATIDTAASAAFTERVKDVHPLCLIVDEVHNAGAPERRRVLTDVDADWRMGLSATWQREGDPDGTAVILDYFERVLEPVYSLGDAIRDGHLCPYQYFTHPLSLTDDEQQAWVRLTARIGAAFGRAGLAAGGELNQSLKLLLIQRARIVKGAVGKVALAADVISEHYRAGQAWLIYCDNTAQLRQVRDAIEARGYECMEYHRQVSGDEAEALAEFERSGGIMLAIKCLDEGVDIPRIDHALILASSTTRREFIQRRGRALRRAPGKHRARIHDVIVDAAGFSDATAASFLRNEISRAREFASSAVDSSAALHTLDQLERSLGVAAPPTPLPPDDLDDLEGTDS